MRAPFAQRNRTSRPVVVVAVAALALVLTVGAGALAYLLGPSIGVYFLRATPQQYASEALDLMEAHALFAEGEEWERARARAEADVTDARSYEETYAAIAQALNSAGGRHSFFISPQDFTRTSHDSERSFVAPTVERRGGVATVTVPPLGVVSEQLQEQYARSAADRISAEATQTCGWIVDLRGNTGGSMFPMISGVTALLPPGPAMFFEDRDGARNTVTMQPDGAGVDGETLTSIPDAVAVGEQPIAVLQDSRTASSGEAVATVFRGLDHVQSFGSDTAGLTTGNEVHGLADGAQLVITSTFYVDRDGESLLGEPIQPDRLTGTLNAHKDAAMWLASQGCT